MIDTVDEQANLLPTLDSEKLLGFRNLLSVTTAQSDLKQSAGLAFTKKGIEGTVA